MNTHGSKRISEVFTVLVVASGAFGCGSSNPPELAFVCVAGPDAGAIDPQALVSGDAEAAADPAVPDAETLPSENSTIVQTTESPRAGDDGLCSSGGWCFELPNPQGNPLYAASGTGPSDVWMAGDLGTVIHFDGKTLAKVAMPTNARIEGLWAASSVLAYAATSAGDLFRYDGAAWIPIVLPIVVDAGAVKPSLHALSATGPGNVWAVGDAGLVLHFDGTNWTTSTSGTTAALRSVWAYDAQNVWAAGDKGTLLHYDGASFSVVSSGVSVALRSIHGGAANDIWAVGDKGTTVHYDGKRWTRRDTGGQDDLYSVRLEGADSVWAVGNHGKAWHWMIVPVANDGGTEMDAASARPLDGAADTRERKWFATTSGTSSGLRSVWTDGGGEFWAVGELGAIVRWDADSVVRFSNGSGENRLAMAGLPQGTIWTVGDAIDRRTADGWTEVETENLRALYGVAVASASDAWAVGTDGTILHFASTDAGSSWTRESSPTTRWLRGIWLSGESGGVIVGQAGTILGLLNGSFWTPLTSGVTSDLRDVWGASVGDIWAVGAAGTILHWHGSSWTRIPSGPGSGISNELRGVWGSSSRDVWAVGAGGAIVHYDGSVWALQHSGESYSLNDVWGTSAMDVWAVGTSGRILHWNGSAWAEEESGTVSSLNAVWGEGSDRVWVVGEDGTVLRRDRK